MRKIILIVFLHISINSSAQIGFEQFYSEKELQLNLQRAKTPEEQIFSAGILAKYYKGVYKDSLASVYINKIFRIVDSASDKSRMGNALWWDAYVNFTDEKVKKLLEFAKLHNLLMEKISANLFLSDMNIHSSLTLSEQYGISAKELLDNWKRDTTGKDSVRVEIYRRLSHVYIHKRDGLSAMRYLLALQDYAERAVNESLKLDAMIVLSDMYFEWAGQKTRAIPWNNKLYDYYKNKRQPNKLLAMIYGLAMLNSNLQNYELAKSYFDATDKLEDSLEVNGSFLYWKLMNRYYMELISSQKAINILDNNFDSRLFLPPVLRNVTKAQIYLNNSQLDSASLYLSKAKKQGVDTGNQANIYYNYDDILRDYYLQKKDFDNAIIAINEIKKSAEKRGDSNALRGVYSMLSDAYKEKNDYKSAFEYQAESFKLRNRLDKLDNEEAIALLEMQKQKEIQDAASIEEKRSQKAEVARIAFRNKVRLYSLLSGVAILLLLAFILLRNNRIKQKAYSLLQEQKSRTDEAMENLKSTQSQLIQSEKMASLGELTAGIAHEIQNPLNFVNNFSEVNSELISDLKNELQTGNYRGAFSIAENLGENEQKIIHHGKRADAIVKSMLQHSRVSTGQKEFIDINALTDEYLRLAYHGFRAKDKSFNALINTDFDKTIQKIEVVPQNIGRAILNILNNAFYSVTTKSKLQSNGYEPVVSISTLKINSEKGSDIAISIKDNGIGIPKNTLDKIYQPFFTTKSTGQGTGLGLSLTYDIVTKEHGGEIKVMSKEGEGAEFIVYLPS